MTKNIFISCDHGGFYLKEQIFEYLLKKSFKIIDLGTKDPSSVDYPDYSNVLVDKIKNNLDSMGILLCGTGIGMSIAANRYESVRAALVHNIITAPKCREHNNSNVLCLGSWTTSEEENFKILNLWLNTNYGEGRHVKRVEKLSKRKKKIIFTNGVFDILHTGHIELLKFAKSLGEKLIVAINSDDSVRALKGPNRPINNEYDRKQVLESLSCVDEVVIFNTKSPKNLIDSIMPSVLVKGGEWTASEVRLRDKVLDEIEIKIYPFLKDYSTTNVIKKIHNKDNWEKYES